ncbi:uncharacterized protein LOC141649750 [Silene latifolia]|uniref:uncharacterized protein LOC141649750 n=1 Tax=Silene latifolia TaxID=37657 RepID=UPI003D77CB75
MVPKFGLWKSICSVKSWDSTIAEVLAQGTKIRVGAGSKIRFWEDKWIGDSSLKDGFPRLFSVSNQKNEFIADLGCWQNGVWQWQLTWRRGLFQWELGLVDHLMSLIEDFTPLPNDVDRVYWEFSKADGYTAKSFVDAFYNLKYEDVERKQWFTLIWKNLALPRYEIILWAVLWKRVNTKDRILKWKTLSWDEMTCVFCRDVLETPNHLFLH